MYIFDYGDVPGIAKIRVSVRQSALDLFSKRDDPFTHAVADPRDVDIYVDEEDVLKKKEK